MADDSQQIMALVDELIDASSVEEKTHVSLLNEEMENVMEGFDQKRNIKSDDLSFEDSNRIAEAVVRSLVASNYYLEAEGGENNAINQDSTLVNSLLRDVEHQLNSVDTPINILDQVESLSKETTLVNEESSFDASDMSTNPEINQVEQLEPVDENAEIEDEGNVVSPDLIIGKVPEHINEANAELIPLENADNETKFSAVDNVMLPGNENEKISHENNENVFHENEIIAHENDKIANQNQVVSTENEAISNQEVSTREISPFPVNENDVFSNISNPSPSNNFDYSYEDTFESDLSLSDLPPPAVIHQETTETAEIVKNRLATSLPVPRTSSVSVGSPMSTSSRGMVDKLRDFIGEPTPRTYSQLPSGEVARPVEPVPSRKMNTRLTKDANGKIITREVNLLKANERKLKNSKEEVKTKGVKGAIVKDQHIKSKYGAKSENVEKPPKVKQIKTKLETLKTINKPKQVKQESPPIPLPLVKQLEEQEILLKGYQAENEKSLARIKELENLLKTQTIMPKVAMVHEDTQELKERIEYLNRRQAQLEQSWKDKELGYLNQMMIKSNQMEKEKLDLAETMNRLRRENFDYQRLVAALVDGVKKRIDNWTSEIERSLDVSIKKLDVMLKNRKANSKVETTNNSLKNLLIQIESLSLEKSGLEKRIEVLSVENSQLKRKSQMKSNKSGLEEIESLSHEKSELEKQIEALSLENSQLKKKLPLKSNNSELEKQIESLSIENSQLKTKLNAEKSLENQIESLSLENSQLKRKLLELNQIESISHENSQLKTKIESVSNENSKLLSQNNEISHENALLRQEKDSLSRLEAQLTGYQSQLAALSSALSESESLRKNMYENTVSFLSQTHKDSATMWMEQQERAMKWITQEAKKTSTDLLVMETDRFRSELSLAQSRYDQVVKEKEDLVRKVAELERRCDIVKNHPPEVAQLAHQIASLKEANHGLRNELEEQQKKMQEWIVKKGTTGEWAATIQELEQRRAQESIQFSTTLQHVKEAYQKRLGEMERRHNELMEHKQQQLVMFQKQVDRLMRQLGTLMNEE